MNVGESGNANQHIQAQGLVLSLIVDGIQDVQVFRNPGFSIRHTH